MKDLIEALTIFMKYQSMTHNPTHCEHDELIVVGIDYDAVLKEDDKRLNELGFKRTNDDCYRSFRFGSA